MSQIAVKVRTNTSDEAQCSAIADKLCERGFKCRHVMPSLQIITGDVEEADKDRLLGVDGVEAVEDDPTIEAK